MISTTVLSVSQINFYLKSLFEGDDNLKNTYIEGEISNFKNHFSSGHFYFSLKDEKSVIKCVMFKSSATRTRFVPEDGMTVLCRGRIDVYERDGQYQLYVEEMLPVGIGNLTIAYEQLKSKLASEGLFDSDTKRPLPKAPKRVAVLTASTGAAIHDIVSVSERRNPAVELVLCPVTVQGEYAAESIINMLDKVYELQGLDIIIIARGGGSFEDLFCFNDEELIRKIYESPIPVISAIGHESDFTLCDFVADVRAATPSAAAEIAIPDASLLENRLSYFTEQLIYRCSNKLNTSFERYDKCISSKAFSSPESCFEVKLQGFQRLFEGLRSISKFSVSQHEHKFMSLITRLEALNPASVMVRGYSLVSKDGKLVKSSTDINVNDEVTIKFSQGSAECLVTNIWEDK